MHVCTWHACMHAYTCIPSTCTNHRCPINVHEHSWDVTIIDILKGDSYSNRIIRWCLWGGNDTITMQATHAYMVNCHCHAWELLAWCMVTWTPQSVLVTMQSLNTVTYLGQICGCNSCLLYTSPSPRDATLSRMPSSA